MRRPASIPKGKWADLWTACQDQLDEPSVAQTRMLERMILNLKAAAEALATASQEPIVRGSMGQPTEHPLFLVASRCDTQARAAAKELRLLKSNGNRDQKASNPFDLLDGEDELATARARKAS